MTNIVKLTCSATTLSAVPSSLSDGEIAIDKTDGKLFWSDSAGVVQSTPLDIPVYQSRINMADYVTPIPLTSTPTTLAGFQALAQDAGMEALIAKINTEVAKVQRFGNGNVFDSYHSGAVEVTGCDGFVPLMNPHVIPAGRLIFKGPGPGRLVFGLVSTPTFPTRMLTFYDAHDPSLNGFNFGGSVIEGFSGIDLTGKNQNTLFTFRRLERARVDHIHCENAWRGIVSDGCSQTVFGDSIISKTRASMYTVGTTSNGFATGEEPVGGSAGIAFIQTLMFSNGDSISNSGIQMFGGTYSSETINDGYWQANVRRMQDAILIENMDVIQMSAVYCGGPRRANLHVRGTGAAGFFATPTNVRVALTDNLLRACGLTSGGVTTLQGTPTVSGLTLAIGDLVLVLQHSDPRLNGVYQVASGAWSRASGFTSNGSITAYTYFQSTAGDFAGVEWKGASLHNPVFGTDEIRIVKSYNSAQGIIADTIRFDGGNRFGFLASGVSAGCNGVIRGQFYGSEQNCVRIEMPQWSGAFNVTAKGASGLEAIVVNGANNITFERVDLSGISTGRNIPARTCSAIWLKGNDIKILGGMVDGSGAALAYGVEIDGTSNRCLVTNLTLTGLGAARAAIRDPDQWTSGAGHNRTTGNFVVDGALATYSPGDFNWTAPKSITATDIAS